MSSPTPRSTLVSRWLAAACGLLALCLLPATVLGQGCVIARGGGGGSCAMGEDGYLAAGQWQTSFAFRWFKSDRHFIGDDEQPQRQAQGTEVINDSYFYDFSATYAVTKRLNLSLTIPFVYHDRSSKYEHQGNSGARYHTQAAGLADISGRFAYWIRNPDTPHRWNLSAGLGLKSPSGSYTARDIFMRSTGPQERYVDSSIQPGDGGWGFSVDLAGFYHLGGPWTAYGSATYLFNPEERVEQTGFSIPDSYLGRAGVDYAVSGVHGLTLSLGGRIEGVPGNDALGYSRGSRRPGFAVAVEPGVAFTKGRYSASLTVPVAVHRRRSTTYGSARPGDAAFADYSVTSAVSIKL